MCIIKKFISVTSHALNPPPLSQIVTPVTPFPLERDVLYGRPLTIKVTIFTIRITVYDYLPVIR